MTRNYYPKRKYLVLYISDDVAKWEWVNELDGVMQLIEYSLEPICQKGVKIIQIPENRKEHTLDGVIIFNNVQEFVHPDFLAYLYTRLKQDYFIRKRYQRLYKRLKKIITEIKNGENYIG